MPRDLWTPAHRDTIREGHERALWPDMATIDPDCDYRRMTPAELEASDTWLRSPRVPPGGGVIAAAAGVLVTVVALLLIWWIAR